LKLQPRFALESVAKAAISPSHPIREDRPAPLVPSPSNESEPAGGAGTSHRYQWAKVGDINAFFGLMLDNVAGLLLMVGLLSGFGFPTEFAVSAMVPGTALGVLIGDLAFFFVAFRLAKKTGRDDVTAMPLGLDTPSTFGIILFILGPSFLQGLDMGLSEIDAAYRTWAIGIWCIVLSGVLKFALAPFTEWVRLAVPRAGLLGSLAAIALVLISFLPLMEILGHPLPGMLALVIVLTTLVGRVPLPTRTPGTLGALIVSGLVFYLLCLTPGSGYALPQPPAVAEWFPTQWMEAWRFQWLGAFNDALAYLPIAFPFAIGTVVGGIDCTESAAAAGDAYDTRTVIGVEAFATLIAGFSGGVIQTTPYIGHPAYKAMGGRAAYTLATALLVGSAGLMGYFAWLNEYIPAPAVYPILVFVGLEITAQSFLATPRRHYAAVALACLPALAFLAMNIPGRIMSDPALAGIGTEDLDPSLSENMRTLGMLSSGFILTSLVWAWSLAMAIDRRLQKAAGVMLIACGMTLFGVIHSPLPGNQLFVPFGPESWGAIVLGSEHRWHVMEFAAAYLACAVFLFGWSRSAGVGPPISDAHEHERVVH
jgi:AGZA family xanthine/uracil permease-like MFS transporter